MKIAVCVSHEKPCIRGILGKIINRRLNDEERDWSNKFITSLNAMDAPYEIINMDRDDWINKVEQQDVIIWKPMFMGLQSSQFFKEKIYFIQHIMGKRVYPNYESIWHFDSKIAQKYLFEYKEIKMPKSFASFDYNESISIADKAYYPTVYKEPNGAGSTGVELLKSKQQLLTKINSKFIYNKISNKIFNTKYDDFGYLYFQEFLDGNPADLRVNIIGNKYAVAFWRMNRENDFRASGSGNIDYNKEIPSEIITYCAKISHDNNFDSMAYDIIFDNDEFVVVEISYGYVDKALYDANGYYILDEKCNIKSFEKGHYWPQQLWVKWVLESSGLKDIN